MLALCTNASFLCQADGIDFPASVFIGDVRLRGFNIEQCTIRLQLKQVHADDLLHPATCLICALCGVVCSDRRASDDHSCWY
jgi:hypothetical protein